MDPIPKYIADKKAGESPQEKTAQYCYSYQRGQCKNPTCKWPHIMQPKGDKGYDNKRARKNNSSNAKQTQLQNPKIPFNIDLPRNTLDHIGPKAGQGMNVGQYSKNHKRATTKLMSLQRNINISGKQGGFSDWSNSSESPFESAQERRQVLMCVRIDEDSQRILRTARQNRDIADKRVMYDHVGLHEETRKLHHRFLINNIANNYEVPNISLREGVNAAFLHAENYQ